MDIVMQNLQDGLLIACIGMGVVMFFLTLMMGVMKITEAVMIKLNTIFPEEIKEEPQKKVQNKPEEEIAVAIAAVMKHKNLIRGGN